MNYKDAGVDIEAGNAFVERLKEKAPSIGGFGGMFRVPSGYEKPILVSGADGVGTKLKIAQLECGGPDKSAMHGIGLDLVAMCVNDVICCGAKPLYFLDYISCEKLDDRANEIVEGIIKGCEMSGCELLGGETAEHGRFSKDYDLAGFCTGIVEKNEIIDGSLIRKGDKIIGLPSSGLHSNGYSLINDMLWRHKITFNHSYIGKPMPELLTPTTIYARQIEMLLNEIPIVGMAHITGGGLEENISRVIPNGLKAQIDWSSWERPDVFNKIKIAGDVEEQEMRKVFNCGIGFCLIVPSEIDYGLQIGEVV